MLYDLLSMCPNELVKEYVQDEKKTFEAVFKTTSCSPVQKFLNRFRPVLQTSAAALPQREQLSGIKSEESSRF